jgi:hypothetical protein
MDKSTPRWKNVPTPSVNAQLTLTGTFFAMLSDGSLCADLESVALPSATPLMPTYPTPGKEMTVGNRRKFAARAPARKKNVDQAIGLTGNPVPNREGVVE